MTNFEKIKNMSVEELAKIIWLYMNCRDCPIKTKCFPSQQTCVEVWEQWLKSEVEEWNIIT